MTTFSPIPHFRIETLYDGEDIVRPVSVQTDAVLVKVGLKLWLLHVAISIGVHFTEHLLDLSSPLCRL